MDKWRNTPVQPHAGTLSRHGGDRVLTCSTAQRSLSNTALPEPDVKSHACDPLEGTSRTGRYAEAESRWGVHRGWGPGRRGWGEAG